MSCLNLWTSWPLSMPKTVVPQQKKCCLCSFNISYVDSNSSMQSFNFDGSGHSTHTSLAKWPASFGMILAPPKWKGTLFHGLAAGCVCSSHLCNRWDSSCTSSMFESKRCSLLSIGTLPPFLDGVIAKAGSGDSDCISQSELASQCVETGDSG